jgi:hypothetical protein
MHFQVMPLHTLDILKGIEKNRNNNVFKTLTEFVLARMKARWDECGVRMLLGDDTGGYRGKSHKF